MSDRPRIGLDNATFRGRLRQPDRLSNQLVRGVSRQPFGPRVADIVVKPPSVTPKPLPQEIDTSNFNVQVVAPQPYARPAHPKQQQSKVLHRRSVKTPYQQIQSIVPPAKKIHHRKKLNRNVGLMAVGSLVLLIGLFTGVSSLIAKPSSPSQAKVLSQTSDRSAENKNTDKSPAETRPTIGDVTNYKVAADQPKIIQIAKLNVYSRVMTMNVNAKNELQTPSNIFDAGWYNGSAKPGDLPGNGATLINGYVTGPTLPGVFANAKKLVAGDVIQIIRGDNKIYTYTVVKTQNFNASSLDIGTALTSAQAGKAALNLITTSGKADTPKDNNKERTVVFAVQT